MRICTSHKNRDGDDRTGCGACMMRINLRFQGASFHHVALDLRMSTQMSLYLTQTSSYAVASEGTVVVKY